MPLLRPTTLLVILGAFLVAVFFLVVGGDKFLIVTYLRLTAPLSTPAPAEVYAKTEYNFDFVGKLSGENLATDSRTDATVAKESFFQLDSPHVLNLQRLSDETARIAMKSYGTFVEYDNGQYNWLKVHVSPGLLTYAGALHQLQASLRTLSLSDRIDMEEYGRHLGPVEDSETWVPVVRLPHATFWPELNCNWERMADALPQLEMVKCRPTLNFSPPE